MMPFIDDEGTTVFVLGRMNRIFFFLGEIRMNRLFDVVSLYFVKI